MPAYTLTDLEALALGKGVPHEVLLAILADSDAMQRLHELRRLASLFEDDPVPLTPIDTDVTLEELALDSEGRLHDPARRAAVEAFLARELSPPAQVGEANPAPPPVPSDLTK
jgi:hypothetical protein